jgi:hypothetical protein
MSDKGMGRLSNLLLLLILVVVVINLAISLVLVSREPAGAASETVEATVAREWGAKVVEIYNRQDDVLLYELFNQQARVKISQQQLTDQLDRLHQLFGKIESHSYVNSVKLGSKGSEDYFQLFFNLRVSQNSQPATMKLSLIIEDQTVSLYGLRIDVTQALD